MRIKSGDFEAIIRDMKDRMGDKAFLEMLRELVLENPEEFEEIRKLCNQIMGNGFFGKPN